MPTGMTTRSSMKRQRIVDVAEILFTRFGVRRITVEEICEKAAVSKMTFYKYFANKLELLKHIWSRWTEEGQEKIAELRERDAPFPEKVQQIIEWKAELTSRMSSEFIEEMFDLDPALEDFMDDMKARTLQSFMDFVASAQDRGEMRRVHPLLIFAVLDKLYELAHDKNLQMIYPSHADFVREVNDFFLFGILPTNNRRRK